jgi:hypothetical protein
VRWNNCCKKISNEKSEKEAEDDLLSEGRSTK